MANRYWVGGSGTWDPTSTTHWSASSGGSGGASVPTSADDVIFDANSFSSNGSTLLLQPPAGNFTILVLGKSITFAAITKTVTMTFGTIISGSKFQVFGDMTLSALLTPATGGGGPTLEFYTATVATLTTAGAVLPINIWQYNTLGGTLKLGDNLTQTLFYGVRILGGGLNTNGKTVTGSYIWVSSEYADTNVTLGSSIINCTTMNHASPAQGANFFILNDKKNDSNLSTTLTFDAGTSTINLGVVYNGSGRYARFTPNGATFHIVNFIGDGTNPGAVHYAGSAEDPTPGVSGQFTTLTAQNGPMTITVSNTSETYPINAPNLTFTGDCSQVITLTGTAQQYITSSSPTLDFVDATNMHALGTVPFDVTHGTDSGNNTNLRFDPSLPACYAPTLISAMARTKQGISAPDFIVAAQSSENEYGLFKKTTNYFFAMLQGPVMRYNSPFGVEQVRFNLSAPLAEGMELLAVLHFDGGTRQSAAKPINTDNYDEGITYIQLGPSNFNNGVRGAADYYFDIRSIGSVLAGVELPIEIDLDIDEDP